MPATSQNSLASLTLLTTVPVPRIAPAQLLSPPGAPSVGSRGRPSGSTRAPRQLAVTSGGTQSLDEADVYKAGIGSDASGTRARGTNDLTELASNHP